MTVCLFVVAANMTYSNLAPKRAEATQTTAATGSSEEVLEVVGRFYTAYDGIGCSTGFIVRGREGLETIYYGPGSMLDEASAATTPKFLTRVRWSNGNISYAALLAQ